MKPLAYLMVCRLINSVRRAYHQPRLMLPGAFLCLGIALQLILFFMTDRSPASEMAPFTSNDLLIGKPGAFLLMMRGLLLLSVFTALITALGEGNTFFDRSDVDYLFPSPLSRRSVLFFKMVGRYISLLFPAAYLPLAFAGAYLIDVPVKLPNFLPGIAGSWLFLVSVTNATQIFLLHPPPRNPKEQARQEQTYKRVQFCLVIVLVAAVGALLIRGLTPWDIYRLSLRFNGDGIANRLLPDAWAADLFRGIFDGYHPSDTWRLLGLLLLAFLSCVWLFSRERDFYESAMELSVRRARITAAVQSGDAGAVLSQMAQEGHLARGHSLPDFGGGARAILWKDMVAATRIPARNWMQLLIPAAFPAILGGLFGRENGLNVLGWTILYSLQMPGIFLLTLRDILRRADISKSLPISPLKLLGGELTLPLVQLTLLGWLSLGMVWASGLWRGPLLLVAVLVLPSLAALLFFVQAVFVLVYPNPNDPAQHAVSGVISLAISLLSLLPAFLVGVPMFFLGASPLVLAGSITIINSIGAGIALVSASRLWQQFDPTD